jgi:hypothetical protein
MNKSLKRFLIVVGIFMSLPVLLVVGWIVYVQAKTGPYKNATAVKAGEYYEIELKRTELLMVHDPFSLILAETYDETFILKSPRINGTVDGTEIPRRNEGYFRYHGKIEFKEPNKMIVDLYYENTDKNTKDPTGWSSEYELTVR